MKILVFDDSPIHRKSAELTLKGHDLTIVGTYDEAQELLASNLDYEKQNKIISQLLVKAGLAPDFNLWQAENSSEEEKGKYNSAYWESEEQATTWPDFDVVLTDLLVPASRQAQGGEGLQFVGQQMPLGTAIALLALCGGVKNVAVVSNENHHHHPASAALDCFAFPNKMKGYRLMCTNHVDSILVDQKTGELIADERYKCSAPFEGAEKYPSDNSLPYPCRKGLESGGKDWGKILQQLFSQKID